eukprot:365555-Chlamydomonas_euryale.AAC.12
MQVTRSQHTYRSIGVATGPYPCIRARAYMCPVPVHGHTSPSTLSTPPGVGELAVKYANEYMSSMMLLCRREAAKTPFADNAHMPRNELLNGGCEAPSMCPPALPDIDSAKLHLRHNRMDVGAAKLERRHTQLKRGCKA